jgi:hypothetical protein
LRNTCFIHRIAVIIYIKNNAFIRCGCSLSEKNKMFTIKGLDPSFAQNYSRQDLSQPYRSVVLHTNGYKLLLYRNRVSRAYVLLGAGCAYNAIHVSL